MFIDSVNFTVSSGNGGAGCVSFRREKFVVKGGPDGGDGGRGGSVFVKIDKNTDTLSWYQGKRSLKAKNGQSGEGKRSSGKKGEDLVLIVPPGTQIIDSDTDELLIDMLTQDDKVLLLEGGKGGLGNYHFKNSRNQAPTYAQPGIKGNSLNIRLELKLIASVGLVGFPNVGKSTLISSVSNARPEVANYEFTTLTPKLGVVNVGEYDSFVIADIPGIIEGASSGKGLGLEFLKHIERTKVLLFMIDLTNYRDNTTQYTTLKEELNNYSDVLSNKPYAVILTKSDAIDNNELNEKMDSFLKDLLIASNKNGSFSDDCVYYIQDDFEIDYQKPFFVAAISSATQYNLKELKYALFNLSKLNSKEQ